MQFDARLEFFAETIKSISAVDGVWTEFYNLVKGLGLDALSYYHSPPPGSVDISEKYYKTIGFEENVAFEQLKNYNLINNPFTSYSNPITEPIFWSNAFKTLTLTASQKADLKTLYCINERNGLVVPVYGPSSRNGCVLLRFADGKDDFSALDIHRVSLAGYLSHIQFCKIRAQSAKNAVHLTLREREVLTWVARGKSNSVIAEIVGISPHTVNGYLRRIYLKTRTSDRTSAALRAVGDSLIDL